MKINGIVLAAGYGSRLAPLTLQIPKPALPVCGKPMMLRALSALFDAGVNRVAVNSHHLKEKIEKCVLESEFADRVELYYEDEILGTAGPLVNAKKLLTDCDCFVLHNGDVISDFNIKDMIAQHIASGASLTMALIEGPENRVHVRNGQIVDILDKMNIPYEDGDEKLTYACISVFSKDFFDCLPNEVKPVSFTDAWLRALKLGKKIMSYRPPAGFLWNDIGSFDQFFAAHEAVMLKGAAPALGCGKPLIIGQNCQIAPDAVFTGFVSMGDNCVVPPGTHLHNCVLLNGAHARSGYSAWEVFGRTFSCHRDQKKLRALKIFEHDAADLAFASLPEQGSDRKFYRVTDVFDTKRILMISGPSDKDFDRFLNLGALFHRFDMKTPEIYRFNREEYTVLMEDLGDGTLYNLCHGGKDDEILSAWTKALEMLVHFQKRGRDAIGEQDVEYRIFTYRLLRWESDYFMQNFLGGLCGIALDEKTKFALDRAFDAIASAAEHQPYVPIHRDFQSQNILLQNDGIRFVDFQGSRLGPYTYDAASLIKDPYMNLGPELRKKLYNVYYELLLKNSFQLDRETYDRDCAVGALQRNMQALGAYGFLSLKKGKMKYLQYAMPCLNLLMDGILTLEKCKDAPEGLQALKKVCQQAEKVLPGRLKDLEQGKISVK